MAATVLAAISCTKEVDNQIVPGEEYVTMSFNATLGTPTKTELGESNGVGVYKVLWSKDDMISIVADDNEMTSGYINGAKFTTDIVSANESATFTGEALEGDAFYAIYPYNESHRWYYNDNRFSAVFNVNQIAGNLENGLAVAKAEGSSLHFKHVCGYIKFEIPNSVTNIKQVSFEGNADETIGGKYVNVVPEAAVMHSVTSSNAVKKITLEPSSGDSFTPGVYYIAALPVDLEEGFTISFTDTDDKVAEKTTNKSASIKAGRILNLGAMTGLSFVQPYRHSLPLSDDFSGVDVLDKYVVDGQITVETDEHYISAGTAPELMLKPQASLTANVDLNGYNGYLTLSFKTNQIGRLAVSVQGTGVEIEELASSGKTYEYLISIPSGLPEFKFSITNKETGSSNNARLDDLKVDTGVIWPQNLSFETTSFSFVSGSSELSSFTGQQVSNAKTTVSYSSNNTDVADVDPSTGVVIVKNEVGTAVITAVAEETAEYRTGTATYSITVSPNVSTTEYTIAGETAVTVADGIASATVNGIKIVQAKKSGSTKVNETYLAVNKMRVYKGHTLSFSGKTFTKIVINCKSGKYGNSLSVNTGSVSIDTANNKVIWEGYSSEEITIYNESTATNVQLQPDTIVVTYVVE